MKKLLKTFLLAVCLLVGGTNSAWGDTYEILYGTAVYTGEVITGVNAQTDFTGDTNETTGVTWSDTNGNSTYTIDGSVLLANTSSAWTKNFTSPITEGKVYFSGNYTPTANGTSNVFQIVDSKGYAIYKSTETCGTSNGKAKNETKKVATVCGVEISSYVRLSKDATFRVSSLCIDLDNRTVEYTLWISSNNSGGSTMSGTIALPEGVTDVQGLSVQQANQNCYLDDVKLYSQLPSGTKYTHILNAVDPEGNKLSTLASHVVYAADEASAEETFYYKKGLKIGDVWYLADAKTTTPHYGHVFTGSETVNVTFRPNEAIVFYAEAEDIATKLYDQVNCADYTSNGNARFFQAKKDGKISTSMSLAAGLYDVYVAAIDRSGKSATLELYRKTTGGAETKIGDVKTSSSNYLYPNTFSNITFEADEELYSQPWTSTNNATFCLDYITVAKSKVTYTVKYMCGETEIKTADASRTAVWGTKVALTAADKEDIANADLGTYEYASDDADDVTIAMDSSSVITVQFTAKSISYTVKAVDQSDNELTTLASGDATADGSTTAYWSKYIKVGGKWYETVDATYGKAIKVANNTVTYKASKISYFNEGETMTGYAPANTQSGTSFSGGVSGRHKANTSWTTTEEVAAGSYIISFPYKAHTSSSSSTVKIYEVKNDESTTLIEELSMTTNGTYTKYNVALAEGSKLRIANETSNNSNWCIDYVTLTKLYEQTTVTDAQTWDWTVVTSDKAYGGLADNTFIKKNSEILLKNVEIYGKMDGSGYTIIDGFGDAQKLLVKAEHPFRYENGKGGYFQGTTVKFTTEVPGTLTVKFSNTGSSNTRELYVNDEATGFTSNSTEMVTASDIEVSAGEVVITAKATDNLTNLAYIRISQITFTPTGVKATIGAYGYATFSSTYALDFSSVTGLKAYKATESDGDKVTMERIEGTVAANTGLVVKGSTAIIPVVNEGDEHGDNMLYACDGSWTTLSKSDTGTNYVLSVQSGNVVFAPINSKPATLRAGTAYLYVPGAGSRALRMSFDDLDSETTAISEELRVKNGEKANAPVYNMQGQRVENPQRGLYISGGKKYFVK